MSTIAALIEAREHMLMRAWTRGEPRELRSMLARDFMMIIAVGRPQLLDRPSFIEACEDRFSCTGYRFREVFVHKHGKSVWFTARVDLEMRVGGHEWSGEFWLTDLWQKAGIKRSWKLVERSISGIDRTAEISHAIRKLQLWN